MGSVIRDFFFLSRPQSVLIAVDVSWAIETGKRLSWSIISTKDDTRKNTRKHKINGLQIDFFDISDLTLFLKKIRAI